MLLFDEYCLSLSVSILNEVRYFEVHNMMKTYALCLCCLVNVWD